MSTEIDKVLDNALDGIEKVTVSIPFHTLFQHNTKEIGDLIMEKASGYESARSRGHSRRSRSRSDINQQTRKRRHSSVSSSSASSYSESSGTDSEEEEDREEKRKIGKVIKKR